MEGEKKERMLKLIWDFRGPDASRTAEHHALHLTEFARNNKLSPEIAGYEVVTSHHYLAFLVVGESIMPAIRDRLKPHRGQIYQDNS